MSENLIKLYRGNIETIEGARVEVLKLFLQIEKHHGEAITREIFSDISRTPSPAEIKQRAKYDICRRYDLMQEKNISALTIMLTEENKHLPLEERAGAGGTNPIALYKYIERALKDRERGLENGTWEGPKPDDWTFSV